MKRIMLLLLTVLFIPIYSHAISLDELVTAVEETPERFYVRRPSYGIILEDKSLRKSYMTNNNSALVFTATGYYIYSADPNHIYKVKMKCVNQGAPNSTPFDLANHGILVSLKVLAVHVYTLDGTFLPEESKEAFAHWQKANIGRTPDEMFLPEERKEDFAGFQREKKTLEQQVRKHSAFI